MTLLRWRAKQLAQQQAALECELPVIVVTGPRTFPDPDAWQRRQDATVKALQAVLGDVEEAPPTAPIVRGYVELE